MKTIQVAFQEFEKSKIKFSQQLADFAAKPQNIDILCQFGVLKYIRPLLLDSNLSVQNSAALALGRISNHSQKLAESVVENKILPQLVISMSQQNIFYKKAACFVLRSLAKHSSNLSQSIVNSGALQLLAQCVKEPDLGVKESASWALAYIAKHNQILARNVAKCDCIPALILSLKQNDSNLKRIASLALTQISKFSMDLAQMIIEGVPNLVQLLNDNEPQLKKQVCQCLVNICKHSIELADRVCQHQLFPRILYKLKDPDEGVRKMAASVIKQIVKQSEQLSRIYVQSGGISITIDYLNQNKDISRIPGIICLGYAAAYNEKIATSIIQAKGINILKESLIQVPDDIVKGVSAWTLGNIGGHSNRHANTLASQQVLIHLLAVYIYPNSSEELKKKTKKALKNIIIMCSQLSPLQPLIEDSPQQIQLYLIKQISKIIAKDNEAKKNLATNDGIRKILRIKAEEGSKLQQAIQQFSGLYPPNIIQFYSKQPQNEGTNKK